MLLDIYGTNRYEFCIFISIMNFIVNFIMNFDLNFIMQERDTLKVISHGQEISKLVSLAERWFDELLRLIGLKDLTMCGYNVVNWGYDQCYY